MPYFLLKSPFSSCWARYSPHHLFHKCLQFQFSLSTQPLQLFCHSLISLHHFIYGQCLSGLFTVWDSQPRCRSEFLKLLILFISIKAWRLGWRCGKFSCVFQKAFITLYLTFRFSNVVPSTTKKTSLASYCPPPFLSNLDTLCTLFLHKS